MDNNKFPPFNKPEDYQLMYHSNTDGHIWVDAQRRPIPLTQQLTGHIDTVDPTHLWNSRVTKQGFHAVPPPISKEEAANSTAITQQPPPHTTPTSPISRSTRLSSLWCKYYRRYSCKIETRPKHFTKPHKQCIKRSCKISH